MKPGEKIESLTIAQYEEGRTTVRSAGRKILLYHMYIKIEIFLLYLKIREH